MVELLLFIHARIFITLFIIDIVHLALTNNILTTNRQRFPIYLTIFVMIEDFNLALTTICCEIELSLTNLLFGCLILLQFKLLSHFLDVINLWSPVLFVFN